jgi:Partial alpha/beta-hydrolase lipase region
MYRQQFSNSAETMNVWWIVPLLVVTFAGGWQVHPEYDAFFEQFSCERDDLFLTTVSSSTLSEAPLVNLNFQPKFIARNNYASESHEVETSDGYLLTLHRIGKSDFGHKKPVVFLMHCIIASSSIWVLYGRRSSIAFKLVDRGYDVWMGNSRGNSYSRAHRTLDPDGAEYWDFSWHEIGVFDLPASIDYVLDKTGQEQLQYIGYSMVSGRKSLGGKYLPIAFRGQPFSTSCWPNDPSTTTK